jgi:hypothetical protein
MPRLMRDLSGATHVLNPDTPVGFEQIACKAPDLDVGLGLLAAVVAELASVWRPVRRDTSPRATRFRASRMSFSGSILPLPAYSLMTCA